MKFSKMIILVSITLLLGGVSLYSFCSGNREDSEEKAHVIRGRRVVRDGKIKRVQRGKKSARVSIKSSVKEKEKPTFDLEAEEEAALTKAQQQLLKEIPDAMDSMLFELNNMRHSVAIETIKQLLVVGGEATQAVLESAREHVLTRTALSERDRQVYRAYVLDGMEIGAVAKKFSITRNYVSQIKTRIDRRIVAVGRELIAT